MKNYFFLVAAISCISLTAKADKVNRYSNSLSVQIGINGITKNLNSFGLQLVPPDLAYSHELFDNDIWNISTATFYDNIGVKINGTNFSYRVGQRIDVGMEFGKYTPYATFGFGTIRYSHHYQTTPVYGAGILKRISKRFLWVNEINFQDVFYRKSCETIVNLSTGFVYIF